MSYFVLKLQGILDVILRLKAILEALMKRRKISAPLSKLCRREERKTKYKTL